MEIIVDIVFVLVLFALATKNWRYPFYAGILLRPVLNVDYLEGLKFIYANDALSVLQKGHLDSTIGTPLQSILTFVWVLLFGFYFIRESKSLHILFRDCVFILFVVWIVIGVLSFIVRGNAETNFIKTLMELMNLLFVYGIVVIDTKECSYIRILYLLVCSSIVPILIALYGLIAYLPSFDDLLVRGVRSASTFNNKNAFSYFLCLVIYAITVLLMENKKSQKHLLLLVYLIIVIITFFTTGSRGALIGATLAFSIVFFRKSIWLLGAVIVLFFILVSNIPAYQAILNITKFEPSEVGGDTFTWRLFVWFTVITNIGDYWPLGIGIGTVLNHMIDQFNIPYDTHNDYLRLLIEYGLIGLFVYLSAIFILLSRALKVSIQSLRFS